jgi:hypothetical protein
MRQNMHLPIQAYEFVQEEAHHQIKPRVFKILVVVGANVSAVCSSHVRLYFIY